MKLVEYDKLIKQIKEIFDKESDKDLVGLEWHSFSLGFMKGLNYAVQEILNAKK